MLDIIHSPTKEEKIRNANELINANVAVPLDIPALLMRISSSAAEWALCCDRL